MSEEIYYAEARELARRIRARELSPVEVLSAHLERIEAVNPRVNALVTMVNDAEDRAKAAESAVMRGDVLGPIHGVPFTIKDCVDTAGVRTTRGSKLFADHVPDADAPVVTRLKDAGGILMAKTNMPEFAMGGRGHTDNLVFGRTVNPWNFERTTSSSSGGEAAALAAGLSPLGIGSDVGGSIRLPAYYCGVVGLKATHGRIPLTGHWPETLLRFMHVGPMTRTVRDVALELSIIAGPDGADHYAQPVPVPDLLDLDAPLSEFRVGWNSGSDFGPVDPEVSEVIERAASVLAEVGCQVEEVSIPGLRERDTQGIYNTVFGPEAAMYLEPIVAGREDELTPNIQRRLGFASPTLREYLEARERCEGFRQDIASYFGQYHVLLCPGAPHAAFPHGVVEHTIAGETIDAEGTYRATVPWDLTGSPAISVPFGWSSEGLPIGVQLVGRHFDEATLLRVAAALEEIGGATTTHPAL